MSSDRLPSGSDREHLLEALLGNQSLRWRRGERPLVEAYLEQYPALGDDTEAVLDLLYHEIFLRERLREQPQLDEYLRRWPRLAEPLRRQFEVHYAFDEEDRSPGIPSQPEATTRPAAPATMGRTALPGYEVLGELGRGGMGVVYRARQRGLGRIVALKMLKDGALAGAEERALFRREAEVVARLRHPHIVQVHEWGEYQGQLYFAMELVDGGSLARKLADGPLPPRHAAALVETLARAVGAAHQQEIVHRDLKPENVLLAADGTPRISDFGLAKRLDNTQSLVASGAVVGTPSYMAPEQARGQGQAVGPPADVYALGAILYECLTGRPPFRAANVMDTLEQVIGQEPVPPRQFNPAGARDLETICLKCLRKDPGRRYPSAEDLAEDLRRFQAGEPIRARPVGSLERLGKWARRRPVGAALVASLALVTLATFGLLLWGWGEAERRRREVAEEQQRTARAFERSESNLYVNRIAWAHRERQDAHVAMARTLLEDCPPWRRHWEWRYLWRLCDGGDFVWRVQSVVMNSATFCPDGQYFAVVDRDRTRVWDASTGREALSVTGHTGGPVGLCFAFSPDGRFLATGSGAWDARRQQEITGEVKVWKVAGWQEALSLRGHAGAVACVTFSPDGRRLATASEDRTVRVWEVATGRTAFILRGHTTAVSSVAFSPDGNRLVSASRFRSEWWVPEGEHHPAEGGEVKVWDVVTGREVLAVPGRARNLDGAGFSPDGKYLVGHHRDRTVRVWDAATGQQALALEGYTGTAFDPGGTRLATGTDQRTIEVWDVPARRIALPLAGHTDLVNDLAFSPDGGRLASVAGDGAVKLWNARTGQMLSTLRGHDGAVLRAVFSPDGRHLATVGKDGTVRLWDTRVGSEARPLHGPSNPVRRVAFSPDGRRVAGACVDEKVRVWDAATGQEVLSCGLPGAELAIISPDGRFLAAAPAARDGDRPPGKVWDAQTGRELFSFRGHTGLSFDTASKRLAGVGDDGAVKIWDTGSGQEILSLGRHANPIDGVVFSPDGALLVSTSSYEEGPGGGGGPGFQFAMLRVSEGEIKVWDVATGREVVSLRGGQSGAVCATFGPGGGLARIGETPGGDVKLVDVDGASTLPKAFPAPEGVGKVTSVARSADRRRLAVAYEDRVVRIWEVETGQDLLSLRGHASKVTALAFSPDGKRLASASEDKTVRVWDTSSGQETISLKGHGAGVVGVAFSPDGDRLLSLGADGSAYVWDASPRPPQSPAGPRKEIQLPLPDPGELPLDQ
jgi:WD40 repeat protein